MIAGLPPKDKNVPRRRHPVIESAPPRLPPVGEALAKQISDVLSDFDVSITAELDEVCCLVRAPDVERICRLLKEGPLTSMKYMRLLTVVDYLEDEAELEVVYLLYSLEHHHKMMLKTRVSDPSPEVPSVAGVWRGAGWYEREMHDLFGVFFQGTPDTRTLILPDDFEGFPGRKNYPINEYDEW